MGGSLEAGGADSILGARRRGLPGPNPLPVPDDVALVDVLEVLDSRGGPMRSIPMRVASEPCGLRACESAELAAAADAFFLRRLRFPEDESPALLFVRFVTASVELS